MMNAQAEEITPVSDIIKLALSTIVLLAGLVAFYSFPDVPLLYRVLGLIAVIASITAVCFTTNKGRSVWLFMLESKQEFKRIVWPTKDEAVKTTISVVVMVLIVGVILWLLDMFLFWAVHLLMSQGIK